MAVDRIERVAREAFGYPALRPGQREGIEAVLAGRDAVVVMSTGSGKSAIYQIAGLLLPGPTVVVSPLIALQRDQVADLRERDLVPPAVGPAGGEVHFWRCVNERAQAQAVAAEVERLVRLGTPPDRIGVLVRSVRHEGQAVAVALEARWVVSPAKRTWSGTAAGASVSTRGARATPRSSVTADASRLPSVKRTSRVASGWPASSVSRATRPSTSPYSAVVGPEYSSDVGRGEVSPGSQASSEARTAARWETSAAGGGEPDCSGALLHPTRATTTSNAYARAQKP